MPERSDHRAYVAWIKSALRDNPQLSQSGLARAMGRERQQVSRMLAGRRSIKIDELRAIESYLGQSAPPILALAPSSSRLVESGAALAAHEIAPNRVQYTIQLGSCRVTLTVAIDATAPLMPDDAAPSSRQLEPA